MTMAARTQEEKFAAPKPNLNSGSKTVAAAGSPEALVAASTPAYRVVIKAKAANTTPVLVGPSTPTYPLEAGKEIVLYVNDLQKIYVDVGVNNEGVDWIAETD